MKCLILAGIALAATTPAIGQVRPFQRQGGVIIQQSTNNTGSSRDVVISRDATGADAITNNSAAGGNASRPEQAIPNGSASGGGGGR